MEFRLLGPVTIVDGDRVVTVRQRRQRALLALLLLHLGETVAVDRILEELWGTGAPRTALASLHNAVSQLRRLVGADTLVTRPPGYALAIEPASLDTVRFEHLLAEAQAALSVQDRGTASLVLGEALALWHGPALADLAYEPFAQAEIRRLEELRQTALEERVDADLARGKHEEVVPELERLIAAEPLRERLHGQLMLALYRSGRQADALATYRGARQTLVDELGIEPGPELRQLEQAILRQDASLLLPGGAPAATAKPMQFRRLATILFADAFVGATGEGELDPETVHRLGAHYVETARTVIARHGGWVDRVAADAVMAAFGAQAADETHAIRAARAALELRSAVAGLNDGLGELDARLELRIGVASGEVLVSGGHEQLVTGDAVRLASGLQQVAGAGEIVIGPMAQRLLAVANVEPFGDVELRGRAAPIAAFRLVDLAAPVSAGDERLEASFVGRKRELKTLRAALRRARETGALEALCVLGPAGIGKSRLAREVVRGARGFDALVGRCLSYGEGITYWPLRELVGSDRAAIGSTLDGDPDADTIADRLTRLDGPAQEIAWAFRRWCEARARRRPLLLVVDDLHWAEPTFLELLEHLAEHGRGPIVLLGLAREELLEDRPEFLAAGRVSLEGLPITDTERLVGDMLGGAALPPEARARVFEAAEGNPLFLEQLIALATEGDPLGADRPIPATVQALLAARLDRLGPGERAVLERAAIVGRDFTEAQVTTLLEPEAVPTGARHLASLQRRGFVRARRSGELRFRHVLVQEAAYRAIPKSLRATLHERFADALDRGRDPPDVLVGYHLERAYQLRTELAPPDRAARRLAEDAGRRLGAAGIRAWQREDAPAAVNLLGRSTALLPESDRRRLELLCELGTALKWMAEDARSAATLEIAAELASRTGERSLELRAHLERAWPQLLRGEVTAEEIVDLAQRAIEVFEAHGDDRGLSRAWHVLAAVQGLLRYQWATCVDAAERAITYYGSTAYSPSGCLSMLAAALAQGPEPVDVAIARCQELATRDGVEAIGRSYVLSYVGLLEAMRGNDTVARLVFDEARAIAEERGVPWHNDWTSIAASIETLGGDAGAAEVILREACSRLEADGDRAWRATFVAKLAEAVYDQGRFAEALDLTEQARKLAPEDDLLVQTAWRRTGARARARNGAFAEANRLATEAVGLLQDTDALNDRGSALVDFAEVLHLESRHEEADEVAERAFGMLMAKGSAAAITHAKARLAEFEAVSPAR